MGLDLEYFSKQNHVYDLQKLNENELKPIIGLLEDVLEEFLINDGFNTKDIIKGCDKAIKLFRDFNFILCGYMNVIGRNDYNNVWDYNLPFYNRTDTERLISIIDMIITNLKRLGMVRESKEKLIDDGYNCLRELRVFYDSMNDYITEEYIIWEAERCRQIILNRRRYG